MSERTVAVASVVALPARDVVALLHRPATVRSVCWPLLTFPDELPASFGVGQAAAVRLRLLGLVPLWAHTLTVVASGDGGLCTEESGGPLRRWRHRLTVEPVDAGSAFYRDEVRYDAGALTGVSVPLVRAFYRWRHRRWAHLVSRRWAVD